jgi:tetratricopeptide (TPR) repeat protein
MGIFKKLINKVLDAEVPPVVEQLVKKGLTQKGAAGENLKPSDTSPFSMVVEDVFTIPRRGIVVSGKIDAGSIKLNDEVTIISESQKKITKVVIIEKFNKLISEAKSGDNVSLLLDKIEQNDVKKGYIVTKDKSIGLVNITTQINPVIYSEREIPDDSEKAKQTREAKGQYASEDKENLKRNMYDWVTGNNCKFRPSHATMNWVRCRMDDPTVCSYDNGTTWQSRPEGAIRLHPGEEDGCNCEAHPYRIEHRVELKIKTPIVKEPQDQTHGLDTDLADLTAELEKIAKDNWDDRKFNKWLKLRDSLAEAKSQKNYQKVIDKANEVLELDSKAKFIGIFVPMFEKDIADAYLKLNKVEDALEHYQYALTGYKEEHEKTNGWVKDIERIEAKLLKLESKKEEDKQIHESKEQRSNTK